MAITFGSTALTYHSSAMNMVNVGQITVASRLAQDITEGVISRGYDNAVDEGPAVFPSPYDAYGYQIVVNYVKESDISQVMDPTVTDFKRVTVIVTHPKIGSVDLYALLIKA